MDARAPAVTVFAVPKPFDGDVATAQRNAIGSWRAGGLDVRLSGDAPGVADAAAELGAAHEPVVERTELGTPLVSVAFERARAVARTPLLLYANADVVLLPGVPEVAGRIALDRFLAVGRRFDVPLSRELAFAPGWDRDLRREAAGAPLDSPFAIDWFLFPREVDWGMPAFAVGRPGWDNWLIWRARDLGVPVVDATGAIVAVHQRHSYAHVPGGTGVSWEGPEAARNAVLAGGRERRLCILDATHVLAPRGVRPARSPAHLRRRLFLLGKRRPWVGSAVGRAAALRRRRR